MNWFQTILNFLLGGGLVAMIVASVAAWRRYKSGEIADDDAIIARLDKDNQSLRFQMEQKDIRIEEERRLRWHAEDVASNEKRKKNEYRSRLKRYEEVEDDE